MVAALAQVDDEVEIHRTTRAEKDRRALRCEARTVRGDQHVGLQPRLFLAADFAQAGRADFLPGLQQEDRVEAETATRLQHSFERGDVDRVLALVVSGAAAVETVAAPGQLPGR